MSNPEMEEEEGIERNGWPHEARVTARPCESKRAGARGGTKWRAEIGGHSRRSGKSGEEEQFIRLICGTVQTRRRNKIQSRV